MRKSELTREKQRLLWEVELPAELTGAVKQLLEIKMNSPEVKLIPRIPEINEYLDESILRMKRSVRSLEDRHTPDWNALNQIFWQELSSGSF